MSEPGPAVDIGPECFASADHSVICWQGVNYYREPDDDELAKVFVVMDGVATEVPAEPTCFDLAHEHLASSCEVRDGYNDRLRAYIEAAILEQAPTWESLFDRGPGQVVGVPDAAIVAAMAASRFRLLHELDPARCSNCGNSPDVCLCPESDGCERCDRARQQHPTWTPDELATVHRVNNHDGTNPERKWPGE